MLRTTWMLRTLDLEVQQELVAACALRITTPALRTEWAPLLSLESASRIQARKKVERIMLD